MPSNEEYQQFLAYFYPFFLITSLLSQSFVIYIIFYHSPKYLQTLKLILFNTCFFQIIHVSTCYIMQLRQVSHMVPIELWSYGPGRHFEAFIGYSLYHVLQSATCISGISVVMTLYLKYEAARVVKLAQWKRVMIIVSLLSPLTISITMEVILVLTTSFPPQIREKYRLINANVEDHSVVGVLDFKVPASQVNVLIMSSSVFLLPIVGLTSRRKTMQHMNNTVDRISAAQRAQNKIFVQGLTLQTFLPLCFYIPISSVYFLAAFTHIEILFQQYFMFLIPAFPALFDPYITLYFVTPYRNRIKIWLKIGRPMKHLTVVSSSINSHF